MAAYCNAACQRKDWTRHKDNCRQLGATREVTKSPLLLAAGMGRLTEVQRLVQQGADLNTAASDGTTPLYMAAMNARFEMVRYLLQQWLYSPLDGS